MTTRELPVEFLQSLIKSAAPNEALSQLNKYVTESLPIDWLGVYDTNNFHHGEWAYISAPLADSDRQQIETAIFDLKPGVLSWQFVPFSALSLTAILIIHCAEPLATEQQSHLTLIADLVANIWVREVLNARSHERIEDMQVFDTLGRLLMTQTDSNELLEGIALSARMLTKAGGAVLWLLRNDDLIAFARAGNPVPQRQHVNVSESTLGGSFSAIRSMYLSACLDGTARCFDESFDWRFSLCLPLVTDSGPLGVLQVIALAGGRFSEEDEWRLKNLASWSTIAIYNSRLRQQMQGTLQRERAYRERMIQNEKLTALGRLVASVAHEVNNPLQIAQMCIGFLQNNVSPDGLETLQEIQLAIDQIADVIQHIKSAYRVPERVAEVTDLNLLIRDVLDMIAHHMKRLFIHLTLELDPALPPIHCVQHEIRQVLLNLTLNAIDAIHENGELLIRSSYIEADKQVAITVQDSGAGMTDDIMASIFEPFFTTKTEGSGLGLAISQDIIHEHGGRITVSSTLGAGTTFIIWLPLQAALIHQTGTGL